MRSEYTLLMMVHYVVSFLLLAAYIAGLVVCIQQRRVSRSMVLCIVAFAWLIGIWLLGQLMSAVRSHALSDGGDLYPIVELVNAFVYFMDPLAIGLLVFGLFRVLSDAASRLGLTGRGERPPLRRDEFDDYEDRPRNPGSRDITR